MMRNKNMDEIGTERNIYSKGIVKVLVIKTLVSVANSTRGNKDEKKEETKGEREQEGTRKKGKKQQKIKEKKKIGQKARKKWD